MKSFLRENPTIAFGLGLPLLLVVVFLLISGVPSLLVAPPQYDLIYATQYYNYQNSMQISVVDNKVQVTYQSPVQNNRKPLLWRYNPKTGAVKEIAIVLPQGITHAGKTASTTEEASKTTLINIPILEGLKVDSSSIAPDGYEFRVGNDRYSGNVFGGLFYSSRYRHQAVLTKDGRSIKLPNSDARYYNRNTHFIGWVVSP
ncbi:hypothetical protein N9Y67_01900 [Pseudomonadota bacterium]|nr:hypothetical protein [Pseudomonadota bacterium]